MESQNIIYVVDPSNNKYQYDINNQSTFMMSEHPTTLNIGKSIENSIGQTNISFYNANRAGSNFSGTVTINSPYARIVVGSLTITSGNQVNWMLINNSYVTSTSIIIAYNAYKNNVNLYYLDPIVKNIKNGSFELYIKNSPITTGTITIYVWFRVYNTINYTP